MTTTFRVVLQGSCRGPWFPLVMLLVIYTLSDSMPAFAEDAAATCMPAVARVVSKQGNVEVRRAGSSDWLRIERLDTPVCVGDQLRTGPLSRAALYVQLETLVRVDQNTTITLSQTADELMVEFFQDDVAGANREPYSCGAAYFITRFPKKFKVTTPHLNAAVEGTEFMVAMRCERTELSVFEGKVLTAGVGNNAFQPQTLTSGQTVSVGGGKPAAVELLVKPADAVQWALYYPPLTDANARTDLPSADQCGSLPKPQDQNCLTQRAEMLLRLGRVEEAQRAIDQAATLDPAANALRAIISIVRNDKATAMSAATAATQSSPNSSSAWLALSYAQQASFELEQALESARKAQTLEPKSSLANARVAELLLSLGEVGEAEASARAAVAANPAESRAHTVLGFVHLAQINTKEARADFEAAIDSDSSAPLPRLGLGLAIIRDGNLAVGREQLEIAVALDPTSSLLRSYVGKAYYEENTKERNALAESQFGLAEQYDAHDPTAPFYAAILKYSQTRPAEALQDLDRARDLNGDRAVYRSELKIDQDLAARNASQATVYNELGFPQLGLTEAAQSLSIDPASTSAHRFLSDIYATLPRHEIARASELLQAQLRQPLGAPPLQPQLANDVLFKNTFFGPATVGLNEFNPLFIRDGQDLQVFGLLGDNDTYGDQVILNVLNGPVSLSLSQFAAHTDGYRPNNDDKPQQYDGFIQAAFGTSTSAQVEVSKTKRESGDLTSVFDPTFFTEGLRNHEDLDTQRLGIRQVIDARSDILLSVIRQDRHLSVNLDDPVFPLTLISDQESWKAEAQYMMTRAGVDVILGASYFEGNDDEQVITPFFADTTHLGPHHVNAYGYLYLPAYGKWPQLQLGVSYDDLSSDVGDQSELNPKLGVIWKLADSVTLRAAGFRVLKRRINSDQGLEPTQLAGFNQFFDDQNGTLSEAGGVAADFTFSPTVTAGLQFTRRNLDVPFFNLTGEVFFQEQTEKVASGYFYWLPSKRLSVSLQPAYQDFEHGAAFTTLKLTEVPLAVRFFLPSGLWMGASVTAVKESGEFTGPGGVDVAGSDDFWVVDAIVAYRLPRRMGTISLQGNNLLNEKFQFQEIEQSVAPRYIPESQVLLRISLSF
jgi:tetratricopeptide (TPR) repeat protein